MKKLTKISAVFTLIIMMAISAAGENFYSYGPDGKQHFKMSTDKILVKFDKEVTFAEKQNILLTIKGLQRIDRTNVLPSPDVTIVDVAGLDEAQIQKRLEELRNNPKVEYANPFLKYEDGTEQGIQDRILLSLRTREDYKELASAAKEYHLQIAERDNYNPLIFTLQTTKNSPGNALEVANLLYESKKFKWVEPDFLLLLEKHSTNDTYIDYQWSLNNTGSSIQFNGIAGADMSVFDAWGISAGNSSIKVAIIDEGVDLNHPDLQANMLSGYDATGLGSAGGPSNDDSHGTACAGIVAAVANNNQGVAGIAYNSKIVPVRIAYDNGSGWVTSNSWLADGINWAWNTGGADVLSNSWGGGSPSSAINSAIDGAVNSGRGGLGAPVLFSAGNGNGAVSYPATYTSTIAVGAMSMCYERKSPSSCDGENWWGSDYGTNLDVAAPGVKVYTTDISGQNGYELGDYVSNFNGTSSACPNAAGVMALILSVNPSLTLAQARFAMESTCKKVGGYTYNSGVSGQPNGTWSNELGYGMVDAYQALLAVAPQVQDDAGISVINAPIGSICSSSITPEVVLNNFGSNTLNSVTINYAVDNANWATYNWTGSLASASNTAVTLPTISGLSAGSHTFDVYTSNPNGQADNNTVNDANSSNFSVATNALTLTIVLDNYGSETTWEIRDANTNQLVASGGPYQNASASTVITRNLCVADGCYDFTIFDSYGDGICCQWGNGSYELKEDGTGNILASGGSFASSETTNFCVQSAPTFTALIESSTDVSCNGGSDGSATASASGGVLPYSYAWSNGATGATANGLSAGTYTVTVTDGNSDQASTNITIAEPTALSYVPGQTDVTCYGADDGSAYILVSGGTSPYTYLWSHGETSFTASLLAAGNYSVTATDANGCTIGTSFTISEPAQLQAIASAYNVSCNGGNDGSVSVVASGGTTPYSYSWSNGATSASVSGLGAGTYSVTVTDANGCETTASATVTQPSVLSLDTQSQPASCGNANDGSVDLSVAGGTAPYAYAWSNGATTEDLGGVSEGTYSVTVTDANGCTASASETVVQQSTLSASASSSDVSCNGGNDGTASVVVSGGTSPYSYAWNNGATTASLSGLSAGTYSVTVTDAAGCTASASTTVSQPSALNLSMSSNDISCNGANDGSASASVSGGTAPYSYAWSNGSTSSSVAGLAAGSYSVNVTDANGCSASASVTISEPAVLSASASSTDASCNGSNDGSVDLSVAGGTTPYNYNWSNGSNSQDLSGVGAGTYSVTVTDANGCTTNTSATVNEPSAISLSFSSGDVSCNGGNDGAADVAVSGGSSPYSYAWSNGASSASNTGLSAATYSVIVTDANGCTASGSVTVSEPSALSLSTNSTNASCGGSDGSAGVNVSGGTLSYSYAWSNGATTASITGLSAGTYTVTVSDGNNCSASASVQVGEDCGCSYVTINSNDFENGYGIWNEGGNDCSLNSNANYASSGTYSVQLRDNTNGSVTFTNVLDLSSYEELTVSFSYITRSMDNSNEDFWLQISTNGGSSYTTVEEWNLNDEFVNEVFYNDQVVIPGPFTSNVRLRFRCDASGNNDWVYLDDVTISGCTGSGSGPTCNDGIQNGDEEGVDCGGTYCTPCATCNDGIQNGDETGVDCGGSCDPCSTCNDGIQNGDETGIDCGGSCDPCATCNDGIQNGDETGVDCGGSECPACPTCFDGIQNGDETGIDCGGSCDPCNGGGGCTYLTINANDFESNLGIWNLGGKDASTNNNASYVGSGTTSIQLRDNSNSSNFFTDVLDLSSYEELTINFHYITKSMDNSSEDFFLEISTNGGSSYSMVEEWNYNDEFVNEQHYNEQVVVTGPFTSNVRLRFRCDASANNDWVYIDDVVIQGCYNSNGSNSGKTDASGLEGDISLNTEAPTSVKADKLNIYPNPATDRLNVVYQTQNEKEVTLVITNMLGQITYQQIVKLHEGENRMEIDLDEMSNGMYVVNFIGKHDQLNKRLIIKR